jgi:Kef-type K+ transport system membrane component KefB
MDPSTPGVILLTLGLALFVGYFAKLLVNKFRIPDVTGYVTLGVLGGVLLSKTAPGLIDSVEIISDLALAIIAFIVGHELRRDVIAKLGKAIFCIAILEALSAAVLVFCAVYFTGLVELHTALIMGAIASATAPAATVFVIHQYKSQGPLTSTILAVVGIDDAIALIIYVFASTMAKGTFTGTKFSVMTLLIPVVSIFFSVLFGLLAGVLFRWLFKNVRDRDKVSIGLAAALLLLMGGAERLHISELLSVMTFSAFITNTSPVLARRSGEIIESFTPVFMPLFFIFAGAHLDVTKISTILVVCLVYTAARATGKIGGASLGGALGGAPPVVRKFAGMGLIPQIGVAVALALAVKREFGDPNSIYGENGAKMASLIINVLLCSTVITESIGPLLTRFALIRSGEAKET